MLLGENTVKSREEENTGYATDTHTHTPSVNPTENPGAKMALLSGLRWV